VIKTQYSPSGVSKQTKPDHHLKIKTNVSHRDVSLPMQDELENAEIDVNPHKPTLSHGDKIHEKKNEEEEKSYMEYLEFVDHK
jgi:hypothetical protein